MGLDLSSYAEGSGGDFSPIDPGLYLVGVADADIRTHNDKERLNLQLQVLGPKFANRRVFTDFLLNESGAGRLYVFLVESGIIDPDDPEDKELLKNFEPKDYDWNEVCKSVKLKVDVVIDEYNGKQKNKVVKFHKASEDDVKALSA